jgi:adenine-specific DNA methylase
MRSHGYTPAWVEALGAYLAIVLDKTLDYNSTVCTWHNPGEKDP